MIEHMKNGSKFLLVGCFPVGSPKRKLQWTTDATIAAAVGIPINSVENATLVWTVSTNLTAVG
jgi:hypothetical protein